MPTTPSEHFDMSSPFHLPLSCSDRIHNDCDENRTLIWLSSHQLQRITFDLDFSSHLVVSIRYQHWISLGAMDYVTGESRPVMGHNRWRHQTEPHSGWVGFLFLFILFSFFTPLLHSFSLVFAIIPSHVWVLCSSCVLQIFQVHFPLALLRFSYGVLSLHFDKELAL
jgi:hypothetical protein